LNSNYAGAAETASQLPADPHGNGPFPANPVGTLAHERLAAPNKDEFLEEAMVLARAGVVSLLIDAPQVRHDFVEQKAQDAGPGKAAE